MSTATASPAPPAGDQLPRHGLQRPRRGGLRAWVPLLLMLAGVAVLLYPVVATQYNNVKQHEFSAQYNNQVQQAEPAALNKEIERARAYNATLSGVPILDPYLSSVSSTQGSSQYKQYLDTLAGFDAMARVRVPAASIDLPVYHGTGDDTLAKGVGHLYGTSLPVGGEGTHAVLTSHTGMSNATLFDHLTKVSKGDLLYVDVYGETLAYEVDNISIVLPTQIDALAASPGRDLLTLFTCTPYAVNTHRLLVTGHRVPFDPAAGAAPGASVTSSLRLEPWMYGLLGGAAATLLLLLIIVFREMRAARSVGRAHRSRRGVSGSRRGEDGSAQGPGR